MRASLPAFVRDFCGLEALCPFEVGLKAIEALKTTSEDFFIAQPELGPAFKYLINPKSLDRMKRIVFEVGIVNDFSQTLHDAIAKAEAFHQGLEGA